MLALSIKWPKISKYFIYYEVIALVLDNILSFAEVES